MRGPSVGREFIAVEGVYDDQWVGREAVFACHGPALTALDIEGDLAAVGALLPQRLVGWVGGEKALDMSIATPGHFCATIPLIASGRRSGTWEVSLIPERTFRPSDLGGSADHRTLSVRLSRLVARGPNGHEIVKTLGPVPAPGSDS